MTTACIGSAENKVRLRLPHCINRRFLATLCLIGILALAAVQAVHFHPDLQAQSGSLNTHCTLCVVTHTASRPQQTYVIGVPARFQPPRVVAQAPRRSQHVVYRLFVRPPPTA